MTTIIIKFGPFLDLYMDEVITGIIDGDDIDFFEWLKYTAPNENPEDHILKLTEI
ncbi:MAG: hypothetical protein PHT94_00640 [Candidatus Nanoarchaeia archaeon]|nr:hypothetical protein [Candidatus Nanoarchaeia archaeon]